MFITFISTNASLSSNLSPKAHELGLIFGSNLSFVENFCLAVILAERLKVEPIFGPKFGPFGSIFGQTLN
jgi:hypothetical protein